MIFGNPKWGVILIFSEGKLFQADAVDVREEDLGFLYSSDVCALNPDYKVSCPSSSHLEGMAANQYSLARGIIQRAGDCPSVPWEAAEKNLFH